jgi:hypothetical protein
MTSNPKFTRDITGQAVEIVDCPYTSTSFAGNCFQCKLCSVQRTTIRAIEIHCFIAHGIRKEIIQVK